jgi:hypothetical protein
VSAALGPGVQEKIPADPGEALQVLLELFGGSVFFRPEYLDQPVRRKAAAKVDILSPVQLNEIQIGGMYGINDFLRTLPDKDTDPASA